MYEIHNIIKYERKNLTHQLGLNKQRGMKTLREAKETETPLFTQVGIS